MGKHFWKGGRHGVFPILEVAILCFIPARLLLGLVKDRAKTKSGYVPVSRLPQFLAWQIDLRIQR
jgi:hypothetical protein